MLHNIQSRDKVKITAGEDSDSADESNLESSDDDDTDIEKETAAETLHFIIDPDIDINSSALIDMVSIEPVAGVKVVTPAKVKHGEKSTQMPNWDW